MNGPEIATAYLTLVPTLKGAGKKIGQELDGNEVQQAADRAGKKAGERMGAGLKAAIGGALATISVGAIAAFATDAVNSFSELEDSTAAASVVFGKNMGAIIKQSKTASTELGLNQQQVINAANTFGTYGKAAGLSGKELSTFATEQTKLAADLASFKGTSPEQAIEAIGAALRGEMEPIRSYGVLLDDNTLRQEAFKMGLISTTKEALTPQQKTLAVQAAIWKQTGDAQGDFARTSQSTANVAKTLAANTEDLKAKIGAQLAPAFTAARRTANSLLSNFSGLIDQWQAGEGAAGRLRDVLGALGGALASTGRWISEHRVLVLSVVAAWAAIRGGIAVWRGVQAAIALTQAVTLGYSAATYGAAGANLVAGNSAKVYTIITRAQAAAARVAAAGQWLMNAALSANPLGVVILLVGAAVAALLWFFTETEVGRKVVAAAWSGIQAATKAVVQWWTNTALPAIQAFFSGAGKAGESLWTALSKIWGWIDTNVFFPMRVGVLLLRTAFQLGRDKITGFFGDIWSGLKQKWGWIDANVLLPFRLGLLLLREAFRIGKEKIGSYFSSLGSGLGTVWAFVRDKVLAKFQSGLGALKEAFRDAKDGISTIWNELKGIAARPVNFMIEAVYNRGIRSLVGKVFDFLDKKNPLPEVAPIKFASGGWTGPGAKYTPAGIVHADEYVISKAARRRIEAENPGALDYMNRNGRLPGYAAGGSVAELSKAARWWQTLGARVSEFGAWGQPVGQHMAGSLHYSGRAADLNYGPGGENAIEKAFFDKHMSRFRSLFPDLGVLWRTTGHFNHAHIDTGGTSAVGGGGRGGFNPLSVIGDLRALVGTMTRGLANNPYAGMLAGLGKQMVDAPVSWLHDRFGNIAEGAGDLIGAVVRKAGVYDRGGWLPAGGVGVNLTGRPEAVLSPAQSTALMNLADKGGNTRPVSLTFNTARVTPRDVVYALRLAELNDLA